MTLSLRIGVRRALLFSRIRWGTGLERGPVDALLEPLRGYENSFEDASKLSGGVDRNPLERDKVCVLFKLGAESTWRNHPISTPYFSKTNHSTERSWK